MKLNFKFLWNCTYNLKKLFVINRNIKSTFKFQHQKILNGYWMEILLLKFLTNRRLKSNFFNISYVINILTKGFCVVQCRKSERNFRIFEILLIRNLVFKSNTLSKRWKAVPNWKTFSLFKRSNFSYLVLYKKKNSICIS